jgi:uracil-DNA glycosylase family 4
MMNAFDQLDDEVLRELKECKKGKLAGQNWTTCKDLSCRAFYFEPNKCTIKKWQEKDGFYKKGIDRRVLFVLERPGPKPEVKEEDISVKRCFSEENANNGAKRKLKRFLDVRKQKGLENCYMTNIVKCSKYSENKHPSVDEIDECSKHLIKEIGIIQPEVIVAVGGGQYDILRRKPFKALIESQGYKIHKITHYAFRGSIEELWERWDREFKELKGKISSSPKFIPIF